MKTIQETILTLIFAAVLISCNNEPKPEAPTTPQVSTETPNEDKKHVKIDMNGEDKKIGVETNGVDIHIDGEN